MVIHMLCRCTNQQKTERIIAAINESLSKVDWEGRFQGNSVNTNWNKLNNDISKAVRSKRKYSSQESETQEEQTPCMVE